MTGRETVFAVGGGVGLLVGLMGLASSRRATAESAAESVARAPKIDADTGIDPAMVANARLAEDLVDCSRQLERFSDDKALLEQQVSDDRAAVEGANRSALARRIARRDLTPSDWKQLARTGTIRYLLPCASFNPDPETINRLGLAPRDVPVIHDAFDAARSAAWTQIRPLCVTALGNAPEADILGLDLCPKVILDSAKAADPRAADDAMRAVAAVRAGMADPATIGSRDTVGTAFLVMTSIAKDAELRIGSELGPEDVRTMVYGSNGCSHMTELNGPGPAREQGSGSDGSAL